MALTVINASDEFIQKLANEYLDNSMSMTILANLYYTSTRTISKILFRGVSEGILDEATSIAIVTKVRIATDNKTRKRWDLALELRNLPAYQEQETVLKNKIKEVHFQLVSYNDFFAGVDGAPSKAYLRNQLAELQKNLNQIQKIIKELTEGLKK